MRFENTTPLAAHLSIGRILPNGRRAGLLLAKATFNFDERGRLRLDDQDPIPLLDADKETPLGLMPRDNMPRNDDAFEVFLLGKAHAPFDRPVPHVRVSLAVGETKRSLDVYGHRFWVGRGPDAVLSAPEPFSEMPLTYSRCFGGTTDVEIDVDSPVEVSYPANPEGVGFDPAPVAASLHQELNCPPGYPRFSRERAVPNVESAHSPLRHWSDAPEPEVWAAVPLASAIHNERCFTLEGEGPRVQAVPTHGSLHRAHPGWVLLGPPERDCSIQLQNLMRNPDLQLRFPRLNVHIDYVLAQRSGSRPLKPRAIVLLPEEQRMTVLYALTFEVEPPTGTERAAKLRIMENI